jgi:hypothetical protein
VASVTIDEARALLAEHLDEAAELEVTQESQADHGGVLVEMPGKVLAEDGDMLWVGRARGRGRNLDLGRLCSEARRIERDELPGLVLWLTDDVVLIVRWR